MVFAQERQEVNPLAKNASRPRAAIMCLAATAPNRHLECGCVCRRRSLLAYAGPFRAIDRRYRVVVVLGYVTTTPHITGCMPGRDFTHTTAQNICYQYCGLPEHTQSGRRLTRGIGARQGVRYEYVGSRRPCFRPSVFP
jgi:hypothetical protein